VPFVPIRCEKPQGPLDESVRYEAAEAPPGFWEDSAREMFKAGRDMMDLVQACQSRGSLVETPILGFGLYTVAFVGIYAFNFPHMDPDGYMCGRGDDGSGTPGGGLQAARTALEMIGQMIPRLPMANNWFRTIHRVHRYYEKIIKDYHANTLALNRSSPGTASDVKSPQGHLSLREGGRGGGEEAFQLLERVLKEFGSIEDEELQNNADRDRQSAANAPDTGATKPESQSSESRSPSSWTAINSIINHGPLDMQTQTNGGSALSQAPTSSPIRAAEPPRAEAQPQHEVSISFHPPMTTPSTTNPSSLTSPASIAASTASASPTPSCAPPMHSPDPVFRTNHGQSPQNASQQSGIQPPLQQHYPVLFQSPLRQAPYASQNTIQSPQNLYPQATQQPPHYNQSYYAGPASALYAQQLSTAAGPSPNTNPRYYTQDMHECWLDSFRKPLSGNDVAAFVDGMTVEGWARQGWWLGEVWGGGINGGYR
jgi:hypothetical protein